MTIDINLIGGSGFSHIGDIGALQGAVSHGPVTGCAVREILRGTFGKARGEAISVARLFAELKAARILFVEVIDARLERAQRADVRQVFGGGRSEKGVSGANTAQRHAHGGAQA